MAAITWSTFLDNSENILYSGGRCNAITGDNQPDLPGILPNFGVPLSPGSNCNTLGKMTQYLAGDQQDNHTFPSQKICIPWYKWASQLDHHCSCSPG